MALRHLLAAAGIAALSTAAAAQTTIGSYRDSSGRVLPLSGVVLFNPDGTVAAISGGSGGGGGGAVTAAANSYATGYSPDLGKIADVAYTDLTGQASGGLVGVSKAQLVRLEAIRAALSNTLAVNNAQVAGVSVATGLGASNTGTQRIALSSDSTVTALGSAGTAFTQGAGAVDASTQRVVPADNGAITTTDGAAAGAVLFTADLAGYSGINFGLTGTFVATVNYFYGPTASGPWTQTSVVNLQNLASTGGSTAAGGFYAPKLARFFRATVSAYTSGTVSSFATALAGPATPLAFMSLQASTATIGNVLRSLPFAPEATSALAASATFTGATRDSGVAAGTAQPWNKFSCNFRSDQAGTGVIEGSNDAFTTVYVEASQPVTALSANTGGALVSTPVFARYQRCKLVNGTTANTAAPVVLSAFGE